MLRPWNGESKPALELSVEMVKMIEDIYLLSIVETDDEPEIHPENALDSPKYESYIEKISGLEKVDLRAVNTEDLFCFFLNIY